MLTVRFDSRADARGTEFVGIVLIATVVAYDEALKSSLYVWIRQYAQKYASQSGIQVRARSLEPHEIDSGI